MNFPSIVKLPLQLSICLGLVTALGGWWIGEGGTFRSKQEAEQAVKRWLNQASTIKKSSVVKNPAYIAKSKECKRILNPETSIFDPIPLPVDRQIAEVPVNSEFIKCKQELKSLKPSLVVESDVKSRRCGYVRAENQYVCRKLSGNKDWDDAKFVYFKIKP